MLAHLPLSETDFSPIVVQHPFFESAILYNGKNMFNAFEQKEEYNQYVNRFCDTIHKCESVSAILRLVRKSYRLTYLKFLRQYKAISLKECGNLLAQTWDLIETINHDANVPKAQVLRWIARADKNLLMNEQDYSIFNSLPDDVTVYRGCKNSQQIKGLSWTIDMNVAIFFANRFSKGNIYQATIPKNKIIAYINDRNEHEIILDYNYLYDITEIKYVI